MRRAIHPAADAEFAEAVRYYVEISPDLGLRFFDEIKRLIDAVSAHPDRFHKFDPPARRYFSATFPYAIIYLEEPDRIWIVAVMHMKRQPGYWRDRIPPNE